MHVLLLGGSGQIGWELQRSLGLLWDVQAPNRAELDLSQLEDVRETVRRMAPSIIVNAAAYTDVDKAESEVDLARQLNARLPEMLALEGRAIDALLIHFSTDYVFDGSGRRPYVEQDEARPLNVYGRTKLEGEDAIRRSGCVAIILRTSWLYSLRRPCFVTRVLDRARREKGLRIAADQVGSPTWSRSIAEALAAWLAKTVADGREGFSRAAGLYHLACRGQISRFEWAREILHLDPRKEEQVVKEVRPASSSEFPTAARRPPFSALDSSLFARTFGIQLPSWDVALRMALSDSKREVRV